MRGSITFQTTSGKELLITFMENLAPTGWTGDALREGGAHEGVGQRWRPLILTGSSGICRCLGLGKAALETIVES